MRKKSVLFALLLLPTLFTLAHGQDIPAVTNGPDSMPGFTMPDILNGGLRISLTATQAARIGYFGGSSIGWLTSLSGNAGYQTVSQTHPFRLVYSGGYLHDTGQSSLRGIGPNTTFQNLSATQTFNSRVWILTLSDDVRYLPQAATTNLSGILGIGNVGTTTPPIGIPGNQGILSNYGQRVTNDSSVDVQRVLTGKTTANVSGSYSFQKFLSSNPGIDNNAVTGQAGVDHRVSALTSFGGDYSYTRFEYPSLDFNFVSQSIHAKYSRKFSRTISTSFAGGPLLNNTTISSLGSGGTSVSFSGSASVTYITPLTTAAIRYTRAVRSGSGVVVGTISDNLLLDADRRFGRYSTVTATAGYTQNSRVQGVTSTVFNIKTILFSVQGTRAIGQFLTTYASYSLQKQLLGSTTTGINGVSGLRGTSQVLSVGITYTPNLIHLSH